MNQTRDDTLFALRYAVRVLERQARLWGLIGTSFKFASILSGTVALGALTSANKELAVVLGVLFAVLQALEHALDPAGKRAEALAQRREYAKVLATQASCSDAELEAAYQGVVADDAISVMQGLKELAYNDVVREQGLMQSACFSGHGLLKLVS